jgi:hypothetical protein
MHDRGFLAAERLLNTRTLLLVTKEANVHGTRWVDLRKETVNYKLNTEAAHFSIGSLHAPIDISGPSKSPRIRPVVGELAARGGNRWRTGGAAAAAGNPAADRIRAGREPRMRGSDFRGTALRAGESGPGSSAACSGTAASTRRERQPRRSRRGKTDQRRVTRSVCQRVISACEVLAHR